MQLNKLPSSIRSIITKKYKYSIFSTEELAIFFINCVKLWSNLDKNQKSKFNNDISWALFILDHFANGKFGKRLNNETYKKILEYGKQ